eukprot:EG_transcript_28714
MAQKRTRAFNVQPARKKLSELFITWLTLPETQDLLNGIILQDGSASKVGETAKTTMRGPLPPPLENFRLDAQVHFSDFSPLANQKLRVVDEWDRMKPKVQSPPSSPKPSFSSLGPQGILCF